MSIIQFLRIFWARRMIIIICAACSLAGANIMIIVVPPKWQAQSRVMLNLLKPDAVTGQWMSEQAATPYANTQVELITDYSVAGQVADELGWLSDPTLIAAYHHRGKNDKRDFRRWLAQTVIDNTKAKILESSNILEISYTANTAEGAKTVADALRKAYLNASLAFRRNDAEGNADWFAAQAEKAKAAFDQAVATRTAYEQANGIVMADDKTDIESAHLQALAMQSGVAAPSMPAVPSQASQSALELAQVDAEIAQASQTLGPNHPELQVLRARRGALAQLVKSDQAAARAAAAAAASASTSGVDALNHAVSEQKARVIGKSDQIGKLTQLTAEVELRRSEFESTAAKAAQYRQEAAIADTGLVPLGEAVTPKAPAFPNKLLILPGSLVLGFVAGIFFALVLELVSRKIRGVEDLQTAVEPPVLAVVAAAPKARSSRGFRQEWRLPRIRLPLRRKTAEA